MNKLLAETAARYLLGINDRPVAPSAKDIAGLKALVGPLPESPSDPDRVLDLLDNAGSPATVATVGGRCFGFVTGKSLPVALAANWLAGAWDQNACMRVMSPTGAMLEEVVQGWIIELLNLPEEAGAGFARKTDCRRLIS